MGFQFLSVSMGKTCWNLEMETPVVKNDDLPDFHGSRGGYLIFDLHGVAVIHPYGFPKPF